ncbi:MAG: RNHCP domain-containing protein [Candidatus Micrarchaeota archaeon]|nr:RNHCP domain-containing protein [Candidatus Micrarchaeota archaeon]
MESKRFSRNKEDFKCRNCGAQVKGTGYTDHCPRCLYSMHMDVNPGDRKAACHGMMRPASASADRKGFFTIYYVCTKCWAKVSCRAAEEDDSELLHKLMSSSSRHWPAA